MSFSDLLTPLQKFERKIRAARDDGEAWYALVRRLDAALDGAPDGDDAAALAEAAEEITGVSRLMWKRYRTALARTERIAREARLPSEALLGPSFATQEIALRIHDRAPKEGLESLASVAGGDVRLADLRERLSLLPPADPEGGEAARAAIVRAKSAGRSLVDRALKDSTEQLWGHGSRIVRRPRLKFMSGDGYEVVARDGAIVAGVDVTDVGVRTNRDRVAESVSPSILMSSFFPKFFLACLATAPRGAAERTSEVLEWLGADWIGVVAVRADGSVDTVRRPNGSPVPDRTARYEAAKRVFGTRPERGGD